MTSERNPIRAASILNRARRNFRVAVAAYRAAPNNPATIERRVDRALAFLAQRSRFVAVRLAARGHDGKPTFRPTLAGAARAACERKAQRLAGLSAQEWRANYNNQIAL